MERLSGRPDVTAQVEDPDEGLGTPDDGGGGIEGGKPRTEGLAGRWGTGIS